VEIEAFIIANLVAAMESGVLAPAPIWTDAKTFDARPFRGKIHGIIGGYPCPGESLAGLREGHLYKGFIWPAIRRAVAAARPLWCFFENVDDHLTGTYPIVQRSLRNMGYRVEAGIYTAEEVGSPHERKRLFILAVANTACERIRRATGDIYLAHGGQNRQLPVELDRTGEKLGDTTGQRLGEAGGYSASASEWLAGPSKKLVYTRGIIQREQANKADALSNEGRTRDEFSNRSEFVAGQGYYQHEWEEPRTIESGVGCTIDGYNFREDLLRALGNSVVEQTAEIAFLDLLSKHLK
jgi:DNA (cytosine-5)-methyltransferase 1